MYIYRERGLTMSTTKCTYVFSIIFLPIYEYYRIGPYANTNLDIEKGNAVHLVLNFEWMKPSSTVQYF